jgi:hypothetical protein
MLFAKAEEQERESDWLGASTSYREAIADLSEGHSLQKAQCLEASSYAIFRGSMQADSLDEFRARTSEAVAGYEKTAAIYQGMSDPVGGARKLQCTAMLTYLAYWLATTPAEKRKLIQHTWALAKKTLQKFKKIGDGVEYGRSYNQLCTSAFLSVSYDPNFQSRQAILRDAAEYGERAIDFLFTSQHPEPLVKACVKTASYFAWLIEYVQDVEEKDECLQKARTYWLKAEKLSEELATAQIASVESYPLYQATAPSNVLTLVEKALAHARRTRDKFAIAAALDFLVCMEWDELRVRTQDPNQRLRSAEKALEHSEEARQHYHLLNFTSPLGSSFLWDESPKAEYHRGLAQDVQSDSDRKLAHLERGLEAATVMLKRAKNVRYPEMVLEAHHVLSQLLTVSAKMETSRDKRRRLLEQALQHREKSAELIKKLRPYQYFNHGLQERNTADIKNELANLVSEPRAKAKMVRGAARHQYASIRLGMIDLPRWERHGWQYYVSSLAHWQQEYATLLTRLYELTNHRRYLQKAAHAAEQAGELFNRAISESRVAECYWMASKAYDTLGEYSNATDGFLKASKCFVAAAEKIPELNLFYRDHSIHMEAWSEIEKSRYHHTRGEYGVAKKHYEAASKLLKTSTQWNYLTSTYAALSHMENAEDLSRREAFEEAALEFETAMRLFQETRIQVQTSLGDTENTVEKHTIMDVTYDATLRAEYSKARKSMEEATLLGRKGDHVASAERFALAAETMERISKRFPSADGSELKYVILVARAWQMAANAETGGLPTLYQKASKLFEMANRLAPTETTRNLVLGHARSCEALGYGQRFLATGNSANHSRAAQLLENATRFYLKAGFHNASEYSKATRRLFDACDYLNRTSTEKDEEKKGMLYLAAEKLLKVAVDSYGETGHIAAKEQAMKLLESAREEKEVALTLSGVFHSQPLGPPSALKMLNRENPIGVEEFQGAYVKANVMSIPENPRLGEPLNLRIELANAGMAPAQLLMVEEAFPKGFEVIHKPNEFSIEGNRLILNGRRLDPLKTQKVDLVLKPWVNGPFAVRPRLSYVDENGNNKFHEPAPLEITVDQESKKPVAFSAPQSPSSPIMEFLIKAFVEDYMRRRLSVEHAGWRGLLEIVRALKLPRSQLYGDARYGHAFGKPLLKLIKSGVTEFRVFPGERGRGGNIVKVRVAYEKEPVRRLVDSSALTLSPNSN